MGNREAEKVWARLEYKLALQPITKLLAYQHRDLMHHRQWLDKITTQSMCGESL
jgi:hypothetical protein